MTWVPLYDDCGYTEVPNLHVVDEPNRVIAQILGPKGEVLVSVHERPSRIMRAEGR